MELSISPKVSLKMRGSPKLVGFLSFFFLPAFGVVPPTVPKRGRRRTLPCLHLVGAPRDERNRGTPKPPARNFQARSKLIETPVTLQQARRQFGLGGRGGWGFGGFRWLVGGFGLGGWDWGVGGGGGGLGGWGWVGGARTGLPFFGAFCQGMFGLDNFLIRRRGFPN